MKMLLVTAILQLGFALHPPMADAQIVKGEPSPALKSCITSNAAQVEQAVPSLDEGVDFLVHKMCAAPLADQFFAQQLEAQERMLAAQRKRMAAMCDTPTATQPDLVVVEPENGYDYRSQMCDPEMQTIDIEDSLTAMNAFGVNMLGPTTSPAGTTLAAQLLLKLRIERMNTKP
jgi:hypothetical protein